MTAAELALALLRTTLATSAAACLAALLLAALRVDSPRTHRVVWLLVVLQGWLLFPWTLEIAAPSQPVVQPIPQGAMSSSSWTWTEPQVVIDSPQITEPEPAKSPLTPGQLALAAWLAGAALLALYAATRYTRIIRALPLGVAPDEPQWLAEWNSTLGGMSSPAWTRPKRIHFRITDALGPLVAYIPFAYILLAPRPLWTTLTPAERTAILRHELAHVRRRDLWKSLIIRLLALPQWFNPFVWRAVHRFDEAAEWACDESACTPAACGLAPPPTTLATALLRTAELTSPQRSVGAVGFISAIPPNPKTNHRGQSALQRRIHRLVTPRFKEESAMRKLAVPILLATIAAAQLIRIERVSADENSSPLEGVEQPSTVAGGDRAQGGSPSSSAAATEYVDDGHRYDASPSADTATSDSSPADPAATFADPAPLKRRPYEEQAWPRYIIEPPDMLQLRGVELIPKGPHKIDAFDVMRIRVTTKLPDGTIDDTYSVDADGTINLGWTYGRVRVVGMTIDEVEASVRKHIGQHLEWTVEVSASLIATAGAQQIDGQHLVAMDGRVNLGVYGSVYVAGMTIEEARAAIEKKLAEHLENPQVAVDVHAYNSKVYYVITKGGDKGDDVVRAPITGNDTVMDAVAGQQIRATDGVKMWINRAGGVDRVGVERVLQVAWNDIASGKSDDTNYTLQPGDRLFIDEPRYREPAVSNDTAYAEQGAAAEPIHDSDLPNYYQHVRPSPQVAPHPLAAYSPYAAPPTPTVRVDELQVHDIVTVLVDPVKEEGIRPASFRVACEIKEIRPNGNLYLEGQAAIPNIDLWPELALSGEVRREEIRPDLTVSSRSIVNLKINKREVTVQTKSPNVTIVLRQKDGEQVQARQWHEGMTVSDALRGAVYPNPINFAEAGVSLHRAAADGVEKIVYCPIGWDPMRSLGTDISPYADQTRIDHPLRPGDRVVIDLSHPRPLASGAAPSATVERPAAAPPVLPAGAPAPPFAQQVMFKLSVVRDRAGDMAELGDSLREDGSATGDTESMLGVLRILTKHKLVEVVADPQLVTVLGRPASIGIEPQPTGDAGEVGAVVVPVSLNDGVLRLEAGMSLGENRIDRGFDLPLGETLVLAAPPHDKAGAGKLYLVVTPELVDAPQPQP